MTKIFATSFAFFILVAAPAVSQAWQSNFLFLKNSVQPSTDILASAYVPTSETTSSTTATDLTTVDSVNLTLSVATTVYIEYRSIISVTGALTATNIVNFDGTDDASSVSSMYVSASNYVYPTMVSYAKALTAGTHTIKIRHYTSTNTVTYNSRMLIVRKNVAPMIAVEWVPTLEATSCGGGCTTNLATLDQVTFTLPTASKVLVDYSANILKTGGTGTAGVKLFVDGVQDAGATANHSVNGNTTGVALLSTIETLSAGSHTLTVEHFQDNAGVSWSNRLLRATTVTGPTISAQFIPTQESISSATASDLATVEQISFTLNAPSNVLLQYNGPMGYSCAASSQNIFYLDGTLLNSANFSQTGGYWLPTFVNYKASLKSGVHTIRVKHISSCSIFWISRLLKVLLVN